MDAPTARPALFRFEHSAPPSASPIEAEVATTSRQGDDRAVAAWRGPVLACGVTIAATAGLAFTVLAPATASRQGGRLTDAPRTGSVILASADEVEERETKDEADAAADSPVVTALHVWDGRPIRAVPTDTLPETAQETGGLIRSHGLRTAGGVTARPDASPPAEGVAPAVWLTGEIAE